jgi:hypothetical protein
MSITWHPVEAAFEAPASGLPPLGDPPPCREPASPWSPELEAPVDDPDEPCDPDEPWDPEDPADPPEDAAPEDPADEAPPEDPADDAPPDDPVDEDDEPVEAPLLVPASDEPLPELPPELAPGPLLEPLPDASAPASVAQGAGKNPGSTILICVSTKLCSMSTR